MHHKFLTQAIMLASENVEQGGGPYAAIIVKDQQIVAEGVNQVTKNQDPTAHAEIMAIRSACKALDHFQLSDCTLYSSCEPCPMCLGAIYWAKISRVFYACTRYTAAAAGFDDSFIYDEIAKPPAQRSLYMQQIHLENALNPFDTWHQCTHKINY